MSTPACTRPANERRSPLHRVLGTAFLVTLLGTGLRADGFGPQQVLSDTADAASDVVAADLDGDGDLDVLTSSEFDTTLSWFENLDGLATFGPERIISSSASEVGSVLAVDLDGDGDLDLLTAPLPAAFPPVDVLSYENVDGLGNFVQMQNVTQGSTELDGIFAADLDGDGDPDLLGTSDGDSRIAWHANQAGSGTFGPQTLIATGIIAARSPHAADVDGDGDADALAGTSYALFGPGAITLYENVDGLATFGPTQVVTTDPFSAEAVLATDLDDDGDLDLLSSENLGDKLSWFENTDGEAAFGPRQVIADDLDGPSWIQAEDLDGDGDLDVLQGGQPAPGDSANRLFLNQGGTLSFVDASAGLPFQAEATFDLAAADLDGDGDPDVLVATAGQELALRNDGPGLFADAPSWLPPVADHTFAVAVADLDLDGDADALLGNLYGNRVLTGLRRQLAWRDVPAVAKPLALDLFAEPGAPWLLGLDLAAAAPAPLPPLGILHLDPANLAIAGSGALDGLGRATPTFAVPAGPALVGLAAFWQSALGSPLALSNLEITTLSGL